MWGAPPCLHTIGIHAAGRMKRYMPDLCIAVSCNAAVRGVGVTMIRPRLSTRTQCTIRAPARDHELHVVPGFRKRPGVPCGNSSWRGHCGGGSYPTCSKGRSASLTKRGCLGAEAYGAPTRNPMRDSGYRSESRGSMGDRMQEP